MVIITDAAFSQKAVAWQAKLTPAGHTRPPNHRLCNLICDHKVIFRSFVPILICGWPKKSAYFLMVLTGISQLNGNRSKHSNILKLEISSVLMKHVIIFEFYQRFHTAFVHSFAVFSLLNWTSGIPL